MDKYKNIKEVIDIKIDKFIKEESPTLYVNKILSDAFYNGKRLRPILAYLINDSLNKSNNTNYNIDNILIISELIHTSSLIIDDLPCMDNDLYRRGKPTIHYKYGTIKAQIIASYLMNLVFSYLNKNLEILEKLKLPQLTKRVDLIYQCLTNNLGINGAPLGQFLDTLPNFNKCLVSCYEKNLRYYDIIKKSIEKKTSTFFEISIVISYIASGGDLTYLNDIYQCANSFGMAFQINDDFLDAESDAQRKFCPNFINHFGKEKSLQEYNNEKDNFIKIINKLGLKNKVFDEIMELLDKRLIIQKINE